MRLDNLLEGFVKYDTPLELDDFIVVGYYPYEVARIRGLKIPRGAFRDLETKLHLAGNFTDNKIVLVCEDTVKFGTHSFGVFLHDLGAVVGKLDDIIKY